MSSLVDFLATKFLQDGKKKNSVPEGVWHKCPQCKETLYTKDLEKALKVCSTCQHHFILTPEERILYLVDENSFKELFAGIESQDPLRFEDTKTYVERLKLAFVKTGKKEAVITGEAKILDQKVGIGVLNFNFLGGSMGAAVGEKITLLIEHCAEKKQGLLLVSASGGARMQEGIFSLMQMAKTSLALNLLKQRKLPFLSLLTNPTMGGVSASFAMLGDVILAEPGALIGFAGPRVIQQTIKQELPQNFQRAEFLLEHGGIDRIVHRQNLRKEIGLLFQYLQT